MPGLDPWDDDPYADDEQEPLSLAPAGTDPWADDPYAEPKPVTVAPSDAGEPPAPVDPPAPPEEPAWYETLLDRGMAFAEGLTKGGQLSLHAPPDETAGPGILAQRERMKGAAGRNQLTRAAGELVGDVGIGMAAPAGFAGQAAAGAFSSGASEMGRSGDPRKAMGAAATGGLISGTLGAATNALTSPARQTNAIRSTLTRGSQEAEAALDMAAGGNAARGQGGHGMDYIVQRAKELVPGQYPSPDKLKQAANASIGQELGEEGVRLGPLGLLERMAPEEFTAYQNSLRGLSADPKNYGMMGRVGPGQPASPMDELMSARQGLAGKGADEPLLRQWTADAALGGMGARAGKGARPLLEEMIRRPSSTPLILAREGLNRLPFYPGAGKGLAQTGGAAAGFLGGGMTHGMPPGADSNAGLQASKPPPIMQGEEKAYATGSTMKWALEDILGSGDTGLSTEEEQRLTNAVMDGDPENVYSVHHQLMMKFPAYARRMEEAMRSVNGDE